MNLRAMQHPKHSKPKTDVFLISSKNCVKVVIFKNRVNEHKITPLLENSEGERGRCSNSHDEPNYEHKDRA